MSIPADKIIPLLLTNSGLPGLDQAAFAALVAALSSTSLPLFRGTAAPATGAPNTTEDCTFTQIRNTGSYVLQATSTQLVVPSTGYYLCSMFYPGQVNSQGVADVNTTAAVPHVNMLVNVQAAPANNNFNMSPRMSYVVTAAGAVTDMALGVAAATSILRIFDTAAQYLRVRYTNSAFDSTNFAVGVNFAIAKIAPL